MLKTRIIPILTINSQLQVVKTIRFQRPYRVVGNLMQYIKVFEKRQLDELMIIDIDASLENRLIDYNKIKEFTKELYCPLTLGGGIRSLDDINKLLQSGADKVCIGTYFQRDWDLCKKASNKFGSQCIIINLDYKHDKFNGSPYNYSGKHKIDYSINNWAKSIENQGAGEILLTSIDRDGTYEGYDLDTIKFVTNVCKIPIIANGGAVDVDNASEALKAGAHAIAVSSVFLFTDLTPRIMAEELNKLGHQCRI